MLKSRQIVADPSPQKQSCDDLAPTGMATPRWIVVLRRALILVLLLAFVAKGFLPAWRSLNSDFPNYYLVAKLYRAGYPLDRVYEWMWLQRQNDRLGVHQGLVSFIPSTLVSALPVLPLISLDPLHAKRVWLIANVLFLGITLFLSTRMTRLGWESCLLLALLAFVPLRNNFLLGQMHLLVLLLLTIAAWLHFSKKHFWSGVTLAAAAALKIYPVLFVLYFIWKRQWRAGIGTMVGSIIAASSSLYLFGVHTCIFYAREVLPWGLRGETLDPYNPAWNSFTALLKRLFIYEPTLNPNPVKHTPGLYALLHSLIHVSILLVFLFAIGRREEDLERSKLEWGSFLFLLLFLSSQPGTYHLVALILAAILLTNFLVAQARLRPLVYAIVAFALVGAPLLRIPTVTAAGWHNLFFFSRLLWMTMLAAVFLWSLASLEPRTFNVRDTAFAFSCIAILTFAGFLSTRRHLEGQFGNYTHRVISVPDDLLANDPVLHGNAVLFTHMSSRGYSVDRIENGTISNVFRGVEDSFHPTSPSDSFVMWAEKSAANGSRIVRFTDEAMGSVELNDAEQPVVSKDGRLLAFIREKQGRNTLLVKTITTDGSLGSEHVVAGRDFDPREAAFTPDDRLLFSSNHDGKFSLYVWAIVDGVRPLGYPACSARYPSPSPDGKWIAFSCEEHGNWNLNMMRADGTQQKVLTSGECNSVNPAWTPDSKRIIYATDCGRGLGLTALATIDVLP